MTIIPFSAPPLTVVFQCSDKYKKLNNAKCLSLDVIENYALSENPNYRKYADKMLNCGEQIKLSTSLEISDDFSYIIGKVSIHHAKWCRVRNCPLCQLARISKIRVLYFQAFKKYQSFMQLPRFTFLTLTVANCPLSKLRQTLNEMTQGWQRFYRRKDFPGIGFLRSMEVTVQRERDPITGKYTGPVVRSPEGELMAHPHFHVLMPMKQGYFNGKSFGKLYKDQAWFTEQWKSCMKIDYNPIVHITAVRPRQEENFTKGFREIPFVNAVLETLKYTVKSTEFKESSYAAEWLYGITEQLFGSQSFSSAGWFSDIVSQEEINHIEETCSFKNESGLEKPTLLLDWNHARRCFNVSEFDADYSL